MDQEAESLMYFRPKYKKYFTSQGLYSIMGFNRGERLRLPGGARSKPLLSIQYGGGSHVD